jgi:hypothetical protein
LIGAIIITFLLIHISLLHSHAAIYSFLSHWFITTTTMRGNYCSFYYILTKDFLLSASIIATLSLLFLRRADLWDFGNCDNNSAAIPLRTPSHIIPEWYLLLWFGFIKAFPVMILGLIFLIYLLIDVMMLGVRNLSSLCYGITNMDHHYRSAAALMVYNWFRAYWTLGLSLFILLLLFPLSGSFITHYFISIQRLAILLFIFIIH